MDDNEQPTQTQDDATVCPVFLLFLQTLETTPARLQDGCFDLLLLRERD